MKKYFYKLFINLILCALIFLSVSCNDEVVAPILGSVSGSVTYINSESKSIGIAGIKIYLIDTNFKPDTVNYSNNNKAILDSTITDENGIYSFENLTEGNYGVVPVSENPVYTFSLDESHDSYLFSVNSEKSSFTVNFNTPDPMLIGGQDQGSFEISIKGKNFPGFEPGWELSITIDRKHYMFLFIQDWGYGTYQTARGGAEKFSAPVVFYYPYGSTSIFKTTSNHITFEFREVSFPLTGGLITRNTYNFDYDLTLSSCPASSEFEYDWTAHTFKRTR